MNGQPIKSESQNDVVSWDRSSRVAMPAYDINPSIMVDHDRLFKELISTFFLEFIALFLPEVSAYIDGGVLEFLDKEIFTDVTSGERHEVDLVAKVRFKGDPTFFLVHVENQAQPQPNFGKRMFTYFARLYEKHDLPIYPIVLFTYDYPRTLEPEIFTLRFPDRLVLDFRFRVIQLARLNWEEFARRENPVASALMAKMNVAPEDRPRVRLACVRLLATLKLNKAKMQVILGFIDTYLRLSEEEEKAYQAEVEALGSAEKEKMMEVTILWKEEGRKEGLQQGLEQGLERGLERGLEQGLERGLEQVLEQGRQQGLLSLVTHQIELRLGPINAVTRGRISELSSGQLERLGVALLSFTDTRDLDEWLQNL